MATPVFRAAGASSAGTTGAVTVAAPAGIATGDLEILISGTIAGGSVAITTAGGSAWTTMPNSPIDVTSGEKLYVWYRIRQAGDGNPIVTPGSDHSISTRLAYTTGTFDSATPIEISVTGTEATSDTSFSWAPGTSTTLANSLVLCIATSGVDSGTAQVPVMTNASLTALASRANYNTASGGGGGFGVTEGYRAAAGAVGTFACTYVGASPKAYLSFAIRSKTPKQTSVAEIGLLPHGIPSARTNHTIHVRARTTSGTTGVIKAALYEGATNRSGDLTSTALTTTLADYVLTIPDASATNITDYTNLSIRIWGYDDYGNALVFEVAQLHLNLPTSLIPPVPGKTSAAAFGSIKVNTKTALAGKTSAASFGSITASTTVAAQNVSIGGKTSAASFSSVTVVKGNVNVAIPGRASAAQFGTVTKVAGNVNVPITGLGTAAAFGSVSPHAVISIGISGKTSSAAFGSLTIAGAIGVSVSGKSSVAAFGSVTTTSVVSVAVAGKSSAASFGSVTTTGSISIAVAGKTSVAAYGSITVLKGNVNASVAGKGSAAAFGTVAASASTIVAVAGVVSAGGPASPFNQSIGPNAGSTTSISNFIGSPSGIVDWSNPGNALSEDGVFATVAVSSGSPHRSNYLNIQGLGLAIPVGSIITGFTLEVKAKSTSAANIYATLLKASNPVQALGYNATLSTTNTWYTVAANNLYGTTWTAEQVNDPTFGIGIIAEAYSAITFSVDAVRLTVFYNAYTHFGSVSTSISAAPQSIAVSGKSSAASFGSVSISTGNVNVSVPGKTTVASFGALAKINVSVPVSGKSSVAAYGSVTVLKGNVNVSVAGKTSVAAFGIPSVGSSITVVVGGKTSSADFGAITASTTIPGTGVAIAGKTSAAAFGTLSIATAITVAIGGTSSVPAFGAVSASTTIPGEAVDIAGKSSAAAFGAVTPVYGNTNVPVSGTSSEPAFGDVIGLAANDVHIPGLTSAAAFGAVSTVGVASVHIPGKTSAAAFGAVTVAAPIPYGEPLSVDLRDIAPEAMLRDVANGVKLRTALTQFVALSDQMAQLQMREECAQVKLYDEISD